MQPEHLLSCQKILGLPMKKVARRVMNYFGLTEKGFSRPFQSEIARQFDWIDQVKHKKTQPTTSRLNMDEEG